MRWDQNKPDECISEAMKMTENDEESLDILLIKCVKSGDRQLAKSLIDKGANINFKGDADSSHSTPLDYAIQNGDFEMADLLFENGATIGAPAFIEKVITYIGSKMDIEDPSLSSHLNIDVQKFMEYGARIKWTENNMWLDGSPLHVLATIMDSEHLVLKMVQNGIDINIQDQDNRTPLLRATQFNQFDIVRVLLENGANPNIPSKYSYEGNPFHVAIKNKRNEMALLMMKYGANVHVPCSDLFGQEHHPLHLAILHQNQGMVKALIEHGCDIETKGIDDFTSLHIAAQKGFEDILVTILETIDANINVQLLDGTLETPLHLATEASEKKCVKVLLEHGACDYLRDSLGVTPFEPHGFRCKHLTQHGDNNSESFVSTPACIFRYSV